MASQGSLSLILSLVSSFLPHAAHTSRSLRSIIEFIPLCEGNVNSGHGWQSCTKTNFSTFPAPSPPFQACLGFWRIHIPGSPFAVLRPFTESLFTKHWYQSLSMCQSLSSALHRLADWILIMFTYGETKLEDKGLKQFQAQWQSQDGTPTTRV